MLLGETRFRRPTFDDGPLTFEDAVREGMAADKRSDAAWTELRQASDELQTLADNASSREHATFDILAERNEVIHRLTGVQLDNPLIETDRDRDALERSGYRAAVAMELREKRIADWRARVTELRGAYPDFAADLDPDRVDRDLRRRLEAAETRRDAALASPDLGTVDRVTATLAGSGLGWLRDPLQVITLAAPGAAVRSGGTVAGRIGLMILTDAAINAGIEVPLAVASQRWRAENGLDAGWRQGLEQVGLAGLFGGTAGGLMAGGAEIVRLLGKGGDPALVATAERVAAGAAEPGDLARLARGLEIDLSAIEKRVAEISERQGEADATAIGERPAGVTADDAGDLLDEALRAAENPDLPPPAGVQAVPPRAADVDDVVSERLSIDIDRYRGPDTPALRIGGQVFTGKSHAEALDKAIRQFGETSPEIHAFDDPDVAINNIGMLKVTGKIFKQVEFRTGISGDRGIGVSEKARALPTRPEPELPAFDPLTVRGRPATFERFDPDALGTDARAYQYKDGGDEAGVTDRLSEVRQWDATASGKIFAHERLDGRLYVADGHQRLGLARRLKAEGDATVRLDGFRFREADGWTVEDVRALAAKKNMQEGSGTAMDAARILRDRPDILDDGLPVSGPMMKKAMQLARLSDDGWRLVVNGLVAEHHGAAVGRLVDDPGQHVAVLAELGKANPETERMTDLYVREILAAGFNRETQSDMFGELAVTRSLMAERVKVLDESLKLMGRDKRLFSSLAQNAELIEAAGNVLDTAGNVDIARTAETVMAMIDRMARSRGPVSDLLTEAAERFAGGSSAAREARAFVDGVRAALERDGLKSLLEGRPAPVLKPAAAVEPATPEAGELAALARTELTPADAGELTAGDMTGQPSIWDLLPDGVDGEARPRFTTAADELAKADAIDEAADLVASCKD